MRDGDIIITKVALSGSLFFLNISWKEKIAFLIYGELALFSTRSAAEL
jgi:hypothetical protein